jgi:hypothetical protein
LDVGRNKNLDCPRLEEALNDALILFTKRLMIKTDAVLQGFHQISVANVIKVWLDVRQFRVEVPILVIISTAVGKEVFGGQAALLAPRDENNDRLRW